MKLTDLIAKLQTELSIFGDELYLSSFINALRAERSSGIVYPELVRQVTLDFSTQKTQQLPNDFLFYVLPTFDTDSKPFFVVDELAFQLRMHNCVTGKITLRGDGRAEATVSDTIPEPVRFTYYTKHLYRFKAWEPNGAAQTNELIFYDFRYYKALNSGTFGLTPPVHTSGTATNGSVSLEYDNRIFDFYDIDLLPQIHCLYPAEICELLVAIYIKRKRGLDYAYEEAQYLNARSLYGGRTNRQTQIDLSGNIVYRNRPKAFDYLG